MIIKKKKIEELEGLRGLAAIAVLISHLIYGIIKIPHLSSLPLFILSSIGAFGNLAVLIFFVLSGFVIGYSNSEPFSKKNLINYLYKRFIRIYPIYLLAILLSFASLNTSFSWSEVFSHLLFLQTWTVPTVATNGALWSLHYEIFFYLLYIITWATNIELKKSIIFCISCSILFLFFNFHLLKILGYYSLWLMGLWLARNYSNLPVLEGKYIAHRFWVSVMIIFTFGWASIYEPILSFLGKNKVIVMPQFPYIFSDIIVSGLVVAIIASLLRKSSPYFKLSFGLAGSGIILAILYAGAKGLFGSLIHYQMALVFCCLIPFTYLIKNAPYRFLIFCAPLGTVSYAVYVIHMPIQGIFYRLFNPQNNPIMDIYPWLVNCLIVIVTFLLAWLLECYIQPILAKQLKYYLKLL